MPRRQDLTEPRRARRVGLYYDPEAFGRFSETVARYLGTARFLVIQTIVVVTWIIVNIVWSLIAYHQVRRGHFDPYPFILLNLVFSTQAAYAAPLILLAQSRQEKTDRAQAERDRQVTARTQADAEFLAREVASIRVSLTDVITSSELDDHLDRLTRAVERLAEKVDRLAPDTEPL
jgi:uncharacterized membrane protein